VTAEALINNGEADSFRADIGLGRCAPYDKEIEQ
jgi:hypothetical protein